MNPLSCREVEEHIELFAAGECEAPLAEQIEQHLAGCSACSAACRETQQLLGLLDVRFQEAEHLQRLRRRLAVEDGRAAQARPLAARRRGCGRVRRRWPGGLAAAAAVVAEWPDRGWAGRVGRRGRRLGVAGCTLEGGNAATDRIDKWHALAAHHQRCEQSVEA